MKPMARGAWRDLRRGSATRFIRCIAAIAIITICSASFLAFPSIANASGKIYPPGCVEYGNSAWTSFCWVGENGNAYTNKAVYVLGVQYVVTDSGYSSHGEDCIFGPNTNSAVVSYQHSESLSADGIVGNNTWKTLQGELSYSGIQDQYGYYYNVHSDGLRFYNESKLSGYPNWFVLDPWYTFGNGYVAMSIQYGTPFCPPS